jgi:phosphatidylinositol alpha-1,6-mannosyltransferase
MIFFSFDYPPNDGGVARLAEQIITGLNKRKHPVKVITQAHFDKPQPAIDARVDTVRVIASRPRRELEAFLEVSKLPDDQVIVSGIWYPDGLITHLAGKKRHIVMAYGLELFPPRQKWRQAIWRNLQKKVLESAEIVIAISHYTADLVRQTAPDANVVIVPLAVDHQAFTPQDRATARERWGIAPDQRAICTVARLYEYKGHDVVFQALAKMPAEQRQSFVYLIAGRGAEQALLQEKARQLGVDEHIRWLGFVAEADLPSLYSACDLFALLSRESQEAQAVEGFGLVFLEAQACGTPVVGTRTGGIPDAVTDGDGGWLIGQDDIDALSAILDDLYHHPEQFQQAGEQARARVEREFTADHYIDRLLWALKSKGVHLG